MAPDGAAGDDLALIEYPDFATFQAIVSSEAYARDAAPHREAALQDWLFLSAVPLPVPSGAAPAGPGD